MLEVRKGNQYSVVVGAHGRNPRWRWEIRRVPLLGVKLYGDGLSSEKAARLEGAKALHQLLDRIAEEEHHGKKGPGKSLCRSHEVIGKNRAQESAE